MAGLNLKLLVTSGCTKLTKRKKNARKEAPTRKEPGRIGISESSTHGALLLDKILCVFLVFFFFNPERLQQM